MRRYGAESKSIAITIFVNILLVALVLDVKSAYNKVTHQPTKPLSKLLRVLKLEATCFDGLEATSRAGLYSFLPQMVAQLGILPVVVPYKAEC